MTYRIEIGNKRYSSWSLRGWLALDAFGLAYDERVTPLNTTDFEALQAAMAPARQVPVLLVAETGASQQVIWDSLAIAEFLAERHPEAGHWPADPAHRARARCLAAEMHSSFGALRREMPMQIGVDLSGRGRAAGVDADIARIDQLWTETLAAYGGGGPYLFGASFTITDAFFAPVASRFETYGVALSDPAARYAAALRAHPSMLKWRAAAKAEPWIEPRYGFVAPAR